MVQVGVGLVPPGMAVSVIVAAGGLVAVPVLVWTAVLLGATVLVGMGVPPQSVAFGGVGENDLAVPTPDGIREPRNRRVTIVE